MDLTKIEALLRKRAFLSIATADRKSEPHAAPKFLYKIEGGCVYLIDYAIARTVANIRINPRASMSFMDLDNLEGYRMTGSVTLIASGAEHAEIVEGFNKKLLQLSAERFIEGMKAGKPTEHYELEIPNRIIVIKVKIETLVRIGRQGELFEEK